MDRESRKLRQPFRNWLQGISRILRALGATEVACQDHVRPPAQDGLERGQKRPNTPVVCDRAVSKWNVGVHSQEYDLTGKVRGFAEGS